MTTKYKLLKVKAQEKLRTGHNLNLNEIAVMIWNPKKETKPLSAMGILKIERRALLKIRKGFAKMGITKLDDVVGVKTREAGTLKFGNEID